ncbi:MAG: hypothetical protein Q8R55_02340 [Candidatus Taylorbacteria bacterium]|nr:hypothetical protein [Candidatus Taylorbacteria bacterium]
MLAKNYIWIVVFVAGLGLIAYSQFGGGDFKVTPKDSTDTGSFIFETATPSPSVSSTPVPTPQPKPSASATPQSSGQSLVQTPVPLNLITGPATCQLSGSINFINANLYETKGAKIAYQNIDDSSRLVFWKITPNDGALMISPNIFANIRPLPNGEAQVGASLYETPTAKTYNLIATITYGVKQPDSSEKIERADCTGQVVVTIEYL